MSSAQAQPGVDEHIPKDLKGHEEDACKLAGVKSDDLEGRRALWMALDAWDYSVVIDINRAYRFEGIERLQLLRQIKIFLKKLEAGKKYSSYIYDMLAGGNGKEKVIACIAEYKKQGLAFNKWNKLNNDASKIRTIISENRKFLEWHDSQHTQFTPSLEPNEVAAISAPKFLMPTCLDPIQHGVIAKEYDNFSKSIPHGNNIPNKTEHKSSQYQRDSGIKNFILQNANGICECCNQDAPFIADDGYPYLEIHHVVRLADGGSDTISNTIAVCPNCHRELHYGAKARELALRLCENIDRLPKAPASA